MKIRKLNLNRMQIDSLMFGLSGFLKDLRFKEDYSDTLKISWNSLKTLVRKDTMDKSEWNFFRLRPANFPTVRIAYASALLYEIIHNELFKKLVMLFDEGKNVLNELNTLFKSPEIPAYWKCHYNFGRKSNSPVASVGSERIQDIIANVILPLMNLYSGIFNKPDIRNSVVCFYFNQKQKYGRNEITRVMEKQIGMKAKTVSEQQALIQLHNFYCVKELCSECRIGKIVFAENAVHEPLRIILY